MSKFGKVCVSLLLALVVFMGVFVGITTKGFKDWSKYSVLTKTEKNENENNVFSEKDFEAKYLFSFYDISFTGVGTEIFNSYISDEKTNYEDYLKYYSDYMYATGFSQEFYNYSNWEGKYCEFLFKDFYQGVRDDELVCTFDFDVADKCIYKTMISSITTTLIVSEDLSEYKELIEKGEDYKVLFKVYKQVIPTLNSQSLYDIEIVYNVYDLAS